MVLDRRQQDDLWGGRGVVGGVGWDQSAIMLGLPTHLWWVGCRVQGGRPGLKGLGGCMRKMLVRQK